MPLAPLISLVLSVALAAPTAPGASPRAYEGSTEAPEPPPVGVEVQPSAPTPTAVEGPSEPEDAPIVDDEPVGDDDAYGDDYDPLRDSPEALRASSWVRSGIVFTAVGGVLTIGSILMALTDPASPTAGNGSQDTARVRASAALGVPGGLMLAGGIAMLAVGAVQRRRLYASFSANLRGGGASLLLRF